MKNVLILTQLVTRADKGDSPGSVVVLENSLKNSSTGEMAILTLNAKRSGTDTKGSEMLINNDHSHSQSVIAQRQNGDGGRGM